MRTRPPTAHFEPYIRGVNPALSYATANVRLSKARKTKTFLYSDDLERAGSIDKSRFSTAFEPRNNHPKYGSIKAWKLPVTAVFRLASVFYHPRLADD